MSIFTAPTATLDTTPPVLAITAFTPNSDSTTTISGTIDLADAGQTISLYAGATLIGTTTSDANGSWTFASVSLPVTSYVPTVPTVKATDAAGNSGSSQYVYRYIGPLPPQYFQGSTLSSGDRQYVFGQTENTTVGSGAEQDIYAGGTDRYSTVGGDQNVYGSAYYTSVFGMQRVYGTAAYATIFAGGEQNVYATGLALDTILQQGAVQIDWGDAFRTTVDGGKQYVAGLADDTIVFSGTQYVEAAGTATNTTIDGGGEQDVYGGGQASGTTIYHGNQLVYGVATTTTINGGGGQTIYAGGTATGTTLNAGGSQFDRGAATNTTINGGEQDVSGSATATTISLGRQLVESGGTASGTTIDSRGEQDVYFGGAANGTTIAGGNQFVYGSADNTTIDSAGFQYLHGVATNTTIDSGGEQNVYADGTATGTTLNTGGSQLDWGAANATTIDGGNQYVYGTATNATILSGVQFVASGATAAGSAISGTGAQIVSSGGAANTTTISGGDQHVWGTADATTIKGGTQHVHGVATNTTIYVGYQKVYADGTATGTTVLDDGTQFVWGVANGTTLTGLGNSAFQDVGPGGIANDTIINYLGIERAVGGAVHNVTFGGPHARLELEQTSSAFTGVIFGWQAQDEIDLGDILFYNKDGSKAGVTLAFTEKADNSGGTLTVSDGSHVASLALLGQYTAASFAVSGADPNGGTVIIDPAHPAPNILAASVQS
jgi:autotransporter passenger strand-loop-strand repeat protein